MDEKPTSQLLENATAHLTTPIIFTVVSSLFLALEWSEHTNFNAIFVSSKFKVDMNAFDFLKVLRNVGAVTPIILLNESNELDHLLGLPPIGFSVKSYNFNAVLTFPFTKRELCQVIMEAIDTPLTDIRLELITQIQSPISDYQTDSSSITDIDWYNDSLSFDDFSSESTTFDERI